jgi:hypothetical protein
LNPRVSRIRSLGDSNWGLPADVGAFSEIVDSRENLKLTRQGISEPLKGHRDE